MKLEGLEGVDYYRFVIRFRWKDGRKTKWVRWAPAESYARQCTLRELSAQGIDPEDLSPGSLCIVQEDPKTRGESPA